MAMLRLVCSVSFVLFCTSLSAAHVGENLCPPATATHTAVTSGSWQDKKTWSKGILPGAKARVLIPAGVTVTNHAKTPDVLWIHVAGTLKVCDHCDTQINVHTVYIPMGGSMQLGMPTMPCQGQTVLEFNDGPYLPGDTDKLSLGLICHGEFMACGQDKTAWGVLASEVPKGATTLTLRDLPYQWKPGDQILLAGTDSLVGEKQVPYQSEYLTIQSVSSRTVTFTKPTLYRHFPWRSDLQVHVANLTRNVVIRSRQPSVIASRGHLMFMSSMNDIRYTLEEGLGRTDKSKEVTDPRKDASGELVAGSDANPRGRYVDHVHKAGPLTQPARRMWVVVRGSPGWGMVNHASHCQWDNCIAVECFGSAFVTEEGQERGHMRRCLAAMNRGLGGTIKSSDADHGRPLLADWGMDGSGFWLQGGLVEVSDCVSFDNSGRGFALFNKTMNGYPRYGAGNPIPDHLRYKIVHDAILLSPEYAQTPDADSFPATPSSTVPQRVFARNTAYGNKIGVQGWSGPTHNGSSKQIWPLSIRGSITDLTLWGRGGKLHLEYTRQMNVDGLRIVGDRSFRPAYNSLSKITSAVLLRNPEVTVRNWSIEGFDGVAQSFLVEGVNDPGGIEAKNLVIEGATVNADGSVTAN